MTPEHNFAAPSILDNLDLKTCVEIARRRKWWIVLSVIALFVGTAVFAHRLPNIYRAETVILVDSQQVPDKYVAVITTGDIAGRLSTLQEQVLSPTRLKTLIESEGLYPDPTGKSTEKEIIRQVQKAITVEAITPAPGKTGSFRIAFSSKDRTIVARITNRLSQMFIDENVKAREEVTQGTADFLESQLQETKQELDEKDAQLREIKTQNVTDLPESKPYHLEALTNLRNQVQAIQDKIQQDQRELMVLQTMLNSGNDAPTVEIDAPNGGDDGGGYQSDVQRLESKLADLKSHYGPNYPDVRRTSAELEKAKKAASAADQNNAGVQQEQSLKPAIQAKPMANHNPVVEAQIEQLQEDMKEKNTALAPLQEQIEFHTSKLQQIPVFEERLARLQEDYDSLKKHYADLEDKEEAAKISHALEVRQKGERFVVLDVAVTPEAPASPNRLLITLAGLIGGLFAGAGLAVLAEVNDQSIRTEKQVLAIFGTPALSEIPQITSHKETAYRLVWRAGMLAGTVVCSAAFGLLLSVVSDKLL